ncbi:uncharacterized protein LOC126372803 [Pectinophora gossypiella]|uniref:uncharacterized protein LOC126372803 n=1 Tax=Pectinophora gossypiella TaxID=13191 RepID=UPI00214E9CEC|nr:uncharacterized protein LOC126372803 [Pectinophora gossypiella]
MAVEVPLVKEIEKHQCLYNFNMPEYNRKDAHDDVWAEVAANVNLTVAECKDKWKNIRSSFVRSLKYTEGKMKKPYYLSNYLQFILPYLKPITGNIDINLSEPSDGETLENTSIDDNLGIKIELLDGEQMSLDTLDAPVVIENPIELQTERPGIRKRRRQTIAMKHNPTNYRNKSKRLLQTITTPRTDNSSMKYFLLSLLSEFDSMSEEQVRTFKIKVMMLIDDIKSTKSQLKQEFTSAKENERLQKRLINLLLKKIENSS